jgi:hypothetical protein
MLSLVLACLLLAPGPSSIASVRTARVRPISNIARAILNEALRRSPTIQQLVTDLQHHDAIVYVELGYDETGDSGATSVIAATDHMRLLRIVINGRIDPVRRIEVLGHELAHALEIARAPEVRDAPSFRALFEAIGYPVSGNAFETDGARAIERLVRADLTRRLN